MASPECPFKAAALETVAAIDRLKEETLLRAQEHIDAAAEARRDWIRATRKLAVAKATIRALRRRIEVLEGRLGENHQLPNHWPKEAGSA